MTLEEIEALVQLAQTKDLATFEVTLDGTSLRLTFDAVAGTEQIIPAPIQEAKPQPPAQTIISPAVGYFHARHPLEAEPTDNIVDIDTPTAFIQSGPLLFAARASAAGQIGEAFVEQGAGVGFGTKLFEIM